MILSRKPDVHMGIVWINEERFLVPSAVSDHMNKLLSENIELKAELEHIRPILTNPELKPAISRDCFNCKFVLRSAISGAILGCKKDNVCEDYVEEKSDE